MSLFRAVENESKPATMPVELNTEAPANEPELHLLLGADSFEEPLWKSLFRELDDFFFPKKLPPLKLESKPEPVRDIWGFYNYKKNGALGSTMVHVVILGLSGSLGKGVPARTGITTGPPRPCSRRDAWSCPSCS